MKNQKEKLRNKPVHHGNESKKKTRNKFAYLKKKGFPDSSIGTEAAYNSGDSCSMPGSGRPPEEEIRYPL